MGADAADQASTADRHEYGVEARELPQQLHANRSLSRDDRRIVVGRCVLASRSLTFAARSLLGQECISTDQRHLRSEPLDLLALRGIDRRWYEDFCRDAELRRCRRNGQRVIAAAGRRDDAHRCLGRCQREQLVGGAARFEGARLLKILELEISSRAGEGAEPAGAHDRCLDDVLETGRRRATFSGQDRPGGLIEAIGERNRAFRVEVLVSVRGATGFTLRTLEVLPLWDLRFGDEERLRHLVIGNEQLAEHLVLPVIVGLDLPCPDATIPHDTGVLERRDLVAPAEACRDL